MSDPLFESGAWYLILNDKYKREKSLSIVPASAVPPRPIALNDYDIAATENWQFFFQDGVYFIRNFEYERDWQLGVTEDDKDLPRMLSSGSGLGMQWNITGWEGENGRYKIENMLRRDDRVFGLDENDDDAPKPTMTEEDEDAHWVIEINHSAMERKPVPAAMKHRYESIEKPLSTPSTSSTQSTTSTSPTSTSSPSSSSSSSSLSSNAQASAGAIAGISIGGAAFVTIIGFLIYYLRRRRSRRLRQEKQQHQYTHLNYADNNKIDTPPAEPTDPTARYPSELMHYEPPLGSYDGPAELPASMRT
ncbi:hypothetical protein AJ80_03387 [Polytolypa hystricis UAMH7299]|uniref:Mid2 domain-containing protein n=1 Tax=Polytolypa hystricis (strain UAMH7299) TaxID=1447883 RepID=A0A2B7YIF8_POLH7|nr:hypothetical protein AJ80_03387 [Polytolypa hystricis UAMH7299]